jgi:cell division protein FtsL
MRYITIAVIALAVLVSSISISVVYASTSNFTKYSSLEKLSNAIDDKKFQDNDINWKQFKNWTAYQIADKDTKHCIQHRYDLSSNLADYEVYDCVDHD